VSPHISPMIGLQDAGNILSKAGFNLSTGKNLFHEI
jgi:hypothetical protein